MTTRRALLLGSATVAGVAVAGVATERPGVRRLLQLERSSPHPVPAGPTGELVSGSFASSHMRATTGWSIAYPAGSGTGASLPVLLTLHGRSGSHRDAFEVNRYDRFLSAAVRRGTPPFALVSVDGGDHSYYHRRRDGTDFPRMLLEELLPMLAGRGLRIRRIGLHGVSMGGYGALLLAQRLGPTAVAVALADAPAVWTRWQDSAPGAFDGPQDFAAHDVLEGMARARSIPTRVTCGSDDPFRPGVGALLDRAPWIERQLGPGAHNSAWWKHVAPAQLAFAGRHLAP